MADALPNPPSAIAEAVSKYRPRVVGKKGGKEVRCARGVGCPRVVSVVYVACVVAVDRCGTRKCLVVACARQGRR